MDVGLLRAPLQQTGNSRIDAAAGDRPCIDANFAGSETTGRQGYSSLGGTRKHYVMHIAPYPTVT